MNWRFLPPLSALRAFAAFHDSGGVQQAGAALNVSHAAISQQLRALEDYLGVSLLDRSGRALALTDDGQRLALALVDGFDTISRAVAEVTGQDAARPVHVSTTTSFAASWLMMRLPAFRDRHPDINLVIAPSPDRQDPRPGGVDVAIRYGRGDWPGLESHWLMPAPIVGVASPMLVGENPPRAPQDLAHYPWLQELGTHETSDWLSRNGVGRSDQTGGVITAPGNLLLDAARAGQGVAITTRVAAQADIEAGRLLVLFEQDDNTAYYLVTRPGVTRSAARKFIAWLRKEVRAASGSA